jgi:hypothetical protein
VDESGLNAYLPANVQKKEGYHPEQRADVMAEIILNYPNIPKLASS